MLPQSGGQDVYIVIFILTLIRLFTSWAYLFHVHAYLAPFVLHPAAAACLDLAVLVILGSLFIFVS